LQLATQKKDLSTADTLHVPGGVEVEVVVQKASMTAASEMINTSDDPAGMPVSGPVKVPGVTKPVSNERKTASVAGH